MVADVPRCSGHALLPPHLGALTLAVMNAVVPLAVSVPQGVAPFLHRAALVKTILLLARVTAETVTMIGVIKDDLAAQTIVTGK